MFRRAMKRAVTNTLRLGAEGVKITAVLSTHHHFDHVGGNEELARATPVRVYGNADDASRIPALTDGVRAGDRVHLGRSVGEVVFIPAHTSGHIAYHFPREGVVFTGDTLFAAGCGRLFEGDPAQMMASLGRLASLPDDTRVYCGHEYTEANARFALTVEPGNMALQQRAGIVSKLRQEGKMTCPTTIGEELKTNPFLRTDSAEIRRILKMESATDAEVFAELRRRKDNFK